MCTPGFALLISRSHVEGGVRDGGVWLDGEGVGQGRWPETKFVMSECVMSKYVTSVGVMSKLVMYAEVRHV